MGTTRDDGSQQSMWVATADLPQGGGHPFYERLDQILSTSGFGRLDDASLQVRQRPLDRLLHVAQQRNQCGATSSSCSGSRGRARRSLMHTFGADLTGYARTLPRTRLLRQLRTYREGTEFRVEQVRRAHRPPTATRAVSSAPFGHPETTHT